MSAVENSSGLSWTAGELEARDDAAAVRRGAQQVGDVELRLAEELVAAAVLEPTRPRSSTPTVVADEAADALQLGLALVGVEEGQQRAQVGEVQQRQPLRVGVVEDERRGSAPASRWP